MSLIVHDHPKRRPGEVMLSTGTEASWPSVKWQTRRRGSPDSDGTFPVFVELWELEQCGLRVEWAREETVR